MKNLSFFTLIILTSFFVINNVKSKASMDKKSNQVLMKKNNNATKINKIETTYKISCSGGSSGNWKKDCDSTLFKSLLLKCLDEGGCLDVFATDPDNGTIIVNPIL